VCVCVCVTGCCAHIW